MASAPRRSLWSLPLLYMMLTALAALLVNEARPDGYHCLSLCEVLPDEKQPYAEH